LKWIRINAESHITGMQSRLCSQVATPISGFHSTVLLNWGTSTTEKYRRETNDFIRHSGGLYDSVADMDTATLDPGTGELKPEFVPDSSIGSPGDKLHPNRAGYQAVANTVDLKVIAPQQ
jgi:lysophospholipase L1-like esterase